MKANVWKDQLILYYLSYGAFKIDAMGHIWRVKDRQYGKNHQWRETKPQKTERQDNRGYVKVALNMNGKLYLALAHRIVWIANYGLIPEGFELNHLNGARDDNRIDNLELVTHSENVLHGYRVLGNRGQIGEKSGSAKLTEEDIRDIRDMYRSNSVPQYVLADIYGVCQPHISEIVNRICWAHVI